MLKLRASRATGRRLGAALACALLALLTVAGPAVGASITFGTASATSSFGNGIDFTQPYSGGTIKSASILITTPDAVGPTIVAIDQAGSSSLTFTMDTSNGQLDPFSPIVAKFEVVLTDGTTLDGPDIHVIYADDRFKWQTKTGKIVRLHYVDASSSFASQMLSLADGGVANSSALFGVSETKPIDFYVYPSQEAFQQGLSEPGTIGGVAMPSYRTCFAIVEPGTTRMRPRSCRTNRPISSSRTRRVIPITTHPAGSTRVSRSTCPRATTPTAGSSSHRQPATERCPLSLP